MRRVCGGNRKYSATLLDRGDALWVSSRPRPRSPRPRANMAISRSDKAVLHAFKLQAEVVTALFNDIEQLRDSVCSDDLRT